MKKAICILLVILVFPMALLACAERKSEKEIEAAIEEFCAAVAENDLGAVLNCTEKDLDAALTEVKSSLNSYSAYSGVITVGNFFGLELDENSEINVLDIEVLDDEANALVKISGGDQIVVTKTHRFTLSRDDDAWLVSEVVFNGGPASGTSVQARLRSFFERFSYQSNDMKEMIEGAFDEDDLAEMTEGFRYFLQENSFSVLQGDIASIYITEDDFDRGTWVLEFENVSDACKGVIAMVGAVNGEFESQAEYIWLYYDLNVIRDGRFVIFGPSYGVDFMLMSD